MTTMPAFQRMPVRRDNREAAPAPAPGHGHGPGPGTGPGTGTAPVPNRAPTPVATATVANHVSTATFLKPYATLLDDLKRLRSNSPAKQDEARNALPGATTESDLPSGFSQLRLEALYLEVLYAINHKVGTTVQPVDKLVDYARDSCDVAYGDHVRLLAKAKSEKPPIVTLYVTIVSGRDLEAKDANGFSDPYCMLGIIPGRSEYTPNITAKDSTGKQEKDKGSAAKKLGDGFRKKLHGDSKPTKEERKADASPNISPHGSDANDAALIPAKYICSTSVKPKTLNPVWNETFRLDVDDPAADVLHIDLWDHDDETNVLDAVSRLNEVKGMKGLYRYFKQIGQSARSGGDDAEVDDFLGSYDVKISTIPSTGLDKWVKLQPRSDGAKAQGELHIRLTLGTREDRGISEEKANTLPFAHHHAMLYLFAEYELRRKTPQEIDDWNGELHECAETILHQHALQGALTDMHKAVCRWIAYSRLSRKYALSAHVLQRTLHKMESLNKPDSLKTEEKDALRDSFEAFIEQSMRNIRQPEVAFPLKLLSGDAASPISAKTRNQNHQSELREANEEHLRNLGYLLQTLAYVYQMDLYRSCCPFGKEIQSEILNALRKRFNDWLQRVNKVVGSSNTGNINSKQTVLAAAVTFLEETVLELTTVLPYNETFQREIAFAYYGSLNKLLLKEVCYRLNEDVHSALLDVCRRVSGAELSPTNPQSQLQSQSQSHLQAATAEETSAEYLQVLKLFMLIREVVSHTRQLSPEIEISEQAIESAKQLQTTVLPWFANLMQFWLNDLKQTFIQHVPFIVELFSKNSSANSTLMRDFIVDICRTCVELFAYDRPETLNYLWSLCELLTEAAAKYSVLSQERLRLQGFGDQEGQFDASEHLCAALNSLEVVRQSVKGLPESLQIQRLHSALLQQVGDAQLASQTLSDLTKFINEAADKLEFDLRCIVYRCSSKMRPEVRKYMCHLCWVPERVSPEECSRDLFDYLTTNTAIILKYSIDKNAARFVLAIWNQVLEQFEEQVDKAAVDAFGPLPADTAPVNSPPINAIGTNSSTANVSADKEKTESFASSAFTFVSSRLGSVFGGGGGVSGSAGGAASTSSPPVQSVQDNRCHNHNHDAANGLTGFEMPPATLVLTCTRLLVASRSLLAYFEKALASLSLDSAVLKNDLYKRVSQLLRWHQVPTLSVIEQYMTDMFAIQHAGKESAYGYLTVRCLYRNDSRNLVVEVQSARDLTPLDSNGLSDPFVCVELYPPHAFPLATKRQTKVVQKSLSPVFEEIFEIPADLTSCRREGSAILFTVMDYDVLFQNDFGGEAVLALRDVPGIFSEALVTPKPTTLPIMHFKQDRGAISVLQRRKDAYARDFAKRRTQVAMQQLKSNN